MLLGIVGAVVGGWIGRALGFTTHDPAGFLMSLAGAAALLARIARSRGEGTPRAVRLVIW